MIHYSTWGIPGAVCEAVNPTYTSRHEHVTCMGCKCHATYRAHVIQRELAFDGNFVNWIESMKERWHKGESTDE